MKRTVILGAALLAGCAGAPSAGEQAALVDNARKASATLAQKLGGELKAALENGGPEHAIGVCKTRAPQIAAEVSQQFGVNAKRVSSKNRNPAGVPDAWEAAAQDGLEKRLAAGEKPETLDTWQIVATPSGKTFRYAKALPTQPLCLTCHGDPATMAEGLKARLAADYPLDKATGYSAGMVRGIISVSRPL